MLRTSLLALALVLFSLAPAHAAKQPVKKATAHSVASSTMQPDLLSFGLGYMNFNKSESHRQAGDFRVEYRWGISLLPLISSYFKNWDPYVQFHPFVGVETTTLGALYGMGGWAMDAYIGDNWVFTWSEAVGAFYPGKMAPLGSVVEFRSQAEFGYRFDNEMRLTAQVSHISNAGITKRNPGAEIAGIYFHLPISR